MQLSLSFAATHGRKFPSSLSSSSPAGGKLFTNTPFSSTPKSLLTKNPFSPPSLSISSHQINSATPNSCFPVSPKPKAKPFLCGNLSNNWSASADDTSSRSFLEDQIRPKPPNSFFPISPKPKAKSFLCGNSSNSSASTDDSSSRNILEVVGEGVSTAFPLWVALGCLMGLLKPDSFNWVQPKWTVTGITVTMLGMGMTLSLDDLAGAMAMPKELFAGFVLQYTVMPLSAFFVSKLLNLPSYYAAGLILVGCCPGGTASNIATYIARGNVALSVLMTASSTLSAVVMTPFLTEKLAGQYVAVDAIGLVMSTLQVVLLPIFVGACLNQYFQSVVKLVSPLMPPIAVATVAVLCGNAIAKSSSAILMSGRQVVLAATLLHVSGFLFGYLLARMVGIDVSSSRTISIEVGMQNSVLGVVLATRHFGNPLTAVPCAVSSVCHSIVGSALAGIWRRYIPPPKQG